MCRVNVKKKNQQILIELISFFTCITIPFNSNSQHYLATTVYSSISCDALREKSLISAVALLYTQRGPVNCESILLEQNTENLKKVCVYLWCVGRVSKLGGHVERKTSHHITLFVSYFHLAKDDKTKLC